MPPKHTLSPLYRQVITTLVPRHADLYKSNKIRGLVKITRSTTKHDAITKFLAWAFLAVNEIDARMVTYRFDQAFKAAAQIALEQETGEAAVQLEAAIVILRYWQTSPPYDATDAQAHVLKFRELWENWFRTDAHDDDAMQDKKREDDSILPNFNDLTLEEDPLGSVIPGLMNLTITTGAATPQQGLLLTQSSDHGQHRTCPEYPVFSEAELRQTLPTEADAEAMQDMLRRRAERKRAKKAKKAKMKVPTVRLKKAKGRKARHPGIGYNVEGGSDNRINTSANNERHRKNEDLTEDVIDFDGRVITGADDEPLGVPRQWFLGGGDDFIT